MKRPDWTTGNAIELLENGEEFFPAVFAAIESARREVLIETFILFEDKVGLALREVLIAAARRGVQVEMTVDGFTLGKMITLAIRTAPATMIPKTRLESTPPRSTRSR